MKVGAKTHFVWTEKAYEKYGYVAGAPVHEEYMREAPKQMYEDGYIIDSTEYEGQTDLFSVLEGQSNEVGGSTRTISTCL